jgi:hypothetical protein
MAAPGRGTPADAIPFAGIGRLRGAVRRTALLRGTLAATAIALLVAAAVTARHLRLPEESLVPEGRSGVIALDMSRSINGSRLDEMGHVLRRFAVPGQRVGLVIFSDTAYELLPPGSPGTELEPLIHLLTPYHIRLHSKKLRLPDTPWDVSFRAGTGISVGLAEAHQSILRHHAKPATVLLVSDLSALADDLPRVAHELVAMHSDHVALRIVALRPAPGDRAVFERLAGKSAFVSASSLGGGGLRGVAEAAIERPVPSGLVAFALALLVVLAVNELWCGRLFASAEERSPA